MAVARSWVPVFDARADAEQVVSCPICCINGAADLAVDMKEGWMNLTRASYQQIIFEGDHFFIMQTAAGDAEVASECARVILRGLNLSA